MKKILLIFGTRPEAIKMAPLANELKKHNNSICTKICVTGQHREMLDQVLSIFDIIPDYDLNIMKLGQDLFDITSQILVGLRDVLSYEKPDLVLVHGDTSTSTAAALAAYYKQIKVGHIEAGLRTYNIYSPYPEELNRQITTRIANYHFAPTLSSKDNLIKENVSEENIFITGNTVIDALYDVLNKINTDLELRQKLISNIYNKGYDITRLKKQKLVLITGHRRENFGNGFTNICKSIEILANKYPNLDFLYPMHLNPNVRKPIYETFNKKQLDNVFFIEPLEYLDFVLTMSNAFIILTDSGGIQEEAPGLGKPVLVMRETTERPEALKAGTVRLVGTNIDIIVSEFSKLATCQKTYNEMSNAVNPYGDGKACQRICEILLSKLKD